MANTFELIASSTVGSGGAASIDLTSIAGTYTDLCLKMSVRTNRSAYSDYLKIGYNGVTTGITYITLEGNASTATSFGTEAAAQFIGEVNGDTSTASTFSSFDLYIPNYAGSNNKSFSVDSVTENNATGANSANANLTAELWSSTSAITSIKISPGVGSLLLQYSTAYLYGVKNA